MPPAPEQRGQRQCCDPRIIDTDLLLLHVIALKFDVLLNDLLDFSVYKFRYLRLILTYITLIVYCLLTMQTLALVAKGSKYTG